MSVNNEIYKKIPTITYDLGVGVSEQIKDITLRFKLKYNIEFTNEFFDTYYIDNFKRPDQIAYEYYGDVHLSWVVTYFNNIFNIYDEMPIADYDIEEILAKKYATEIEKRNLEIAREKEIDQHYCFVTIPEKIAENNSKLSKYNNIVHNIGTINKVLDTRNKLNYKMISLNTETLKQYKIIEESYINGIKSDIEKTRRIISDLDVYFANRSIDVDIYNSYTDMISKTNNINSSITSLNNKLAQLQAEKIKLQTSALYRYNYSFSVYTASVHDTYVQNYYALVGFIRNNVSNIGIQSSALDGFNLSISQYSAYSNFFNKNNVDSFFSEYLLFDYDMNSIKYVINRATYYLTSLASAMFEDIKRRLSNNSDLVSLARTEVLRLNNLNLTTDVLEQIISISTAINDNTVKNNAEFILAFIGIFSILYTDYVNNSTVYDTLIDIKSNYLNDNTPYSENTNSIKSVNSQLSIYETELNSLSDSITSSKQYIDSTSTPEVLENVTKYNLETDTLNNLLSVDVSSMNGFNSALHNNLMEINHIVAEIDSLDAYLKDIGYVENVIQLIEKIKEDNKTLDDERKYILYTKKYPDFLDTPKYFYDEFGNAIYVDTSDPNTLKRINNGYIKFMSVRDYEYLLNDKKRTIYLLKREYIDVVLKELKAILKING